MRVLGFDEVGRGCLAGPVVAACVCFPAQQSAAELGLDGLTDSKKLTPLKRETLVPRIEKIAHFWAIGWASVEEIDQYNIRVASLLSMLRALAKASGLAEAEAQKILPYPFAQQPETFREAIVEMCLSESQVHLQFDGRDTLGEWLPQGLQQHAIIGGDLTHPAISAASVVAKVFRDKWMCELDARDPRYAFSQHKGYGSELHRERLREHGPSELHRKSFSLGI